MGSIPEYMKHRWLSNSVETIKMEVLQETVKELRDAIHAIQEEVAQLKQAAQVKVTQAGPKRERKLKPC